MRKLFRPWIEGFQGMVRHFGQSFSTIMVVALTLLVVGSLSLISMNVSHLSKNIEDSVEIYVEINKTHESKYLDYKKELEGMTLVANVEYITKDESMENAINEISETYANYLGDNNPYHDIFLVRAHEGASIEWVSSVLEGKEWTNMVYYGGEDTQNMIKTLSSVISVTTTFAGALVVVAIMLIINTIKLSVNNRKEEIKIMRILGAKKIFIISPFVVEGILIGALGSIIPIILLTAGYSKIVPESGDGILSGVLNFIPASETNPTIIITLLALGVGVGLLASIISVVTYLRKVR